MRIGELAKRSGLNASRIRFYEAEGLLSAVSRRANGYREYPSDALLVLEIITRAQQAGFALAEIRELLPMDLLNWKHEELIGALRRKVADIEGIQRRLAENRSQLQALIQRIEDKPEGMDCIGNAKRVMEKMLNGDLVRPL